MNNKELNNIKELYQEYYNYYLNSIDEYDKKVLFGIELSLKVALGHEKSNNLITQWSNEVDLNRMKGMIKEYYNNILELFESEKIIVRLDLNIIEEMKFYLKDENRKYIDKNIQYIENYS